MDRNDGSHSQGRCHIVLIPGFGGFDALGQVEYYAGITPLFQRWKRDTSETAVLHYFDNLPSAAVTTRAERLERYLAKRIARGEIVPGDRLFLVGHSTGGLDIRQLMWNLHSDQPAGAVDGALDNERSAIRKLLEGNGVIFLSVPHWGTNIAAWVSSHALLRMGFIAYLRATFAGSRADLVDRIEAAIVGAAAEFLNADILLAIRDALTESNDQLCKHNPTRVAAAQEAFAELGLYLRHMATDFHVMDDLTPPSPKNDGAASPAHWSDSRRRREREYWDEMKLRTLSYATVGNRLMTAAAPVLGPVNPLQLPEIAAGDERTAGTDVSYRLCYRLCAGGPLTWPIGAGTISRVLAPPQPPEPLQLWDNDGIVNTVSMLWPRGETVLALADHLDIVGHYRLEKAAQLPDDGCAAPRIYYSYDSLRSNPATAGEKFSPIFEAVWTEIFNFCAGRKYQTTEPRPVRTAVATGTAL